MARLAGLAAIGILLITVTFGYRFATMGGPLGGFENDEFVTLSQAQQILLGDLPMRDYVEMGLPLTAFLSAGGLAAMGHTLFAEAVVTILLLGVCAACLFWLSWRASGSIWIALAVALVQIAMAPRFYNYPKLLAYAIAIPACWWYIDRPSRGRLSLLALAGAFAFLLRHDHGVYVGVAAVAAVAAAHWPDVRRGAIEIALVGVMTLLLVSPYLAWMQMHGGVVQYFQSFVVFANRAADRTNLQRPRFSVEWSLPAVMRVRAPQTPPRVNIRWAPGLIDETRVARERTLGMSPVERRGPDVWNYALADWSKPRLEAIVRDPMIADTQGIDRTTFVLNDPGWARPPTTVERLVTFVSTYRVLPAVLRSVNAVPFLYYLMYVLPIAALAIVLLRGNAASPVSWNRSAAKIGVVAVLALAIDYAFLRGNLPSRLADVSEVNGVLGAWLAGVLTIGSARRFRAIGVAVTVLVLVLTVLSIEAIEHVSTEIVQTGALGGPGRVRARTRDVYRMLRAAPPVEAFPDDTPGMERAARYVNVCTKPEDRVLAVTYVPELFFMSARGFAGGHVWIQPDFSTRTEDQESMIARTQSHRTPIAFTDPEPAYTDDYVESFPKLAAFLASAYREAGTIDFGRGVRLRLLVRRDLPATGRFPYMDLPCFS